MIAAECSLVAGSTAANVSPAILEIIDCLPSSKRNRLAISIRIKSPTGGQESR